MAKATYKRGEIRTIKFTAGGSTDYAVDEVILFRTAAAASRVGVARQAIPRGTSGIVAVSGVFEFEKETAANTLSSGHPVNINSDGKVEQPGATEVDGITRCGIAMANSADGDTHVDIDISAVGIGGANS